jgi:hypothetical protein
LLEYTGYFTRCGEPAGFVFGKYLISIYNYVEYTVASRDKVCLYPDCLTQFFRQTGGLRPEISALAIMDIDFHFSTSCIRITPEDYGFITIEKSVTVLLHSNIKARYTLTLLFTEIPAFCFTMKSFL